MLVCVLLGQMKGKITLLKESFVFFFKNKIQTPSKTPRTTHDQFFLAGAALVRFVRPLNFPSKCHESAKSQKSLERAVTRNTFGH